MALGFCPAILVHLEQITRNGYAGKKVTPPGFLQYLLSQPDRPTVIQTQGFQQGHNRTVNIKYRVRGNENYVNTTESCDIDLTPAWKETSQTISQIAQIGLYFDDATIRQYCTDASNMVTFGTPPTQVMADVMDGILTNMNGLYQAIDKQLLTTMASAFGINRRTGLATTSTINVPLDGTQNNLATGAAQVMADVITNEFCGQMPTIVGSGNWLNFELMRQAAAVSANQSGINLNNLMSYQFFHDIYASSQWGTNQIGVFEESAVHLLEDLRNVGSFAGDRGESFFATFADPRVQCWSPQGMSNVRFDIHVKFINCPTTLTNGYAGGTATFNRGVAVYISKHYDLFAPPADQYDGADILAGVRGSLRYTITNT
jgi:hypothetical protein